jgi:hypothetical protein
MSLPEFVLARIAEDAAAARECHVETALPLTWGFLYQMGGTFGANVGIEHIARHDPARVLAECEAKRRIVEHWKSTVEWAEDPGCDSPDRYLMVAAGLYEAMRHLAEPFADHPDYQPEWRV